MTSTEKARRPLASARAGASATIAGSDAVARLRGAGRTIIDLGSGDPDFATPEHIVEAGVRSMRSGRTHYAPSRGVPELLQAIADDRRNRAGVPVDPATDVVVTPSAKYGLQAAILGLVGLAEPVMILTPSWVSYPSMVDIAGANPYLVELPAAENFRVTRELLERSSQPGTRMIIVNSPSNPTGRVLDVEELSAIAEYASDHDVLVLSDEIYEDITFDRSAVSISSLPGMAERTIVVSGFSKAFAMTGWRLGYIVAPAALSARILAVHQHVASCATTFVQDAGVAALRGSRQCVDIMVAEYRRRRDLAVATIAQSTALSVRRPEGAFYLLIDVSGSAHPDGRDFAAWALESAGVNLVPGTGFGAGAEHHVRLALTNSIDVVDEAVRRLVQSAEDARST